MALNVVVFFVLVLPGGLLALAGGCPVPEDDAQKMNLNMLLLCGLALLAAGVITITIS